MATASDIEKPANEQVRETQQGQLTRGISRRNALKAGMAVSSGLIFGEMAMGTAGATKAAKGKTENIVPVHHFVRAEKAEDGESPFKPPTPPEPRANELLVERVQDLPVDDGTDPSKVDGETGQLTWGQFRDVEGRMKLRCLKRGTHVSMHLSGLIPEALYTAWVVVFERPGFIDDRNLSKALQNMVGFAPLGKDDGSENVFRPSASGEAQITAIDKPVTFPEGNLGPAGKEGDGTKRCLLKHFEAHFVGGYHLDDKNQGSSFRPNAVEQFAFIARNGCLR